MQSMMQQLYVNTKSNNRFSFINTLVLVIVCFLNVTSCGSNGTDESLAPTPSIAAPANLLARPGFPAVTLTWDAVAGAQRYNLYAATQSGVGPTNWNLMPDGEVYRGVMPPYQHKRTYKDATYYYVVTAEVNGYESTPSTEVSDPNQYIFDDFERPDQLQGGTALTGQTWVAGGFGYQTYGIVDGRMVSTLNVYPRLSYRRQNFRFGASFSFSDTSDDGSSIVLIADGGPEGWTLRNMVHLQLRKTGWSLIYRSAQRTAYTASVNDMSFSYPYNPLVTQAADLLVRVNDVTKTLNVDYVATGAGNPAGGFVVFNAPLSGGEAVEIYAPGPFENIIGGSQSLAGDGTVYSAAITIVGDTVTLELPDGTTRQTKDSRIQDIIGNALIWQLTNGGCRNESVYATPVTN